VVYGYYSYASRLLDDELATYWTLPAAFGSATCGDDTLLPPTLTYLQTRFPWLKIGEVLADGRTHADGTVRLAREIPYGSPAWKARYSIV